MREFANSFAKGLVVFSMVAFTCSFAIADDPPPPIPNPLCVLDTIRCTDNGCPTGATDCPDVTTCDCPT